MFRGSPGASKAPPAARTSADSRKAELPPQTAPEPPKGPAGFEVVFESRKQQPRGPAPPAVEKPLPAPPPAPGGEKEAPGDFTQVFYGRDESKAMPPNPEPAAARTRLPSLAPDQPSQSEGAGEFTRLFQAQHVKEKPPAAASVEAGQTRPFAQPVQPTAQKGSGDFTRRSSAVESEGPGEFTRLFHAGPQPTRPAGPPIPPVRPSRRFPCPVPRASKVLGN
jgi:hypothetical protein